MCAAHHKLDNLCAIIDYNKLQSDAPNEVIMRLEPLADKWRAFGWTVFEIDGHNIPEILSTLHLAASTHDRPSVLIAHTVKGKGVPYMEDSAAWHGSVKLTRQQADDALPLSARNRKKSRSFSMSDNNAVPPSSVRRAIRCAKPSARR